MKIIEIGKKVFYGSMILAGLFACTDKKEKAEEREEAKTGTVYDSTQQGIEHENRDNQFPESRNDNSEGNGLETGAPTDTTDADGDIGTKPMKQ